MKENPYYDYDAVRDLSMFFDRQDELQRLYAAIDKRQCISIVGARHIGKSSLLKFLGSLELQKRCNYELPDRIFILTDLREYTQKTREDFFESVCEQIIAQSRQVIHWEGSLPPTNGQDKFKKLLQDIRGAGYRPVLLMDAFDRVTKNIHFDPDFFSFLRALAGAYDLISYVTASIKPLYEVSHSEAVATSPFFNVFQTLQLGPLTLEETKQLIVSPAQSAGHPFTQREVEWIITRVGRHPFFVQVACRLLFDEKLRCGHAPVDLALVQERIYKELLPHFHTTWKEDLNEEQRKELQHEFLQPTNARRRMPEFSESLLFRKSFQDFSLENRQEITLKEVRDALDSLDDTAFLEESTISKMHYISVQAQRAGETSTKKGTLVREFLKTALERMRPGGVRSDGALEWRSYNILWYHYFKYHLANQKTAARLGIGSTRQFYREQDRAMQLLLKEMLEMETEARENLEN